MNRIYRLIWNHRTGSLVAVSEATAGRSKAGSKAKTIATAVAGALLALGSGAALATNACPSGGGITTVQVSYGEDCLVGGPSDSIQTLAGPAVKITDTIAGAVSNAGTISSGDNAGITIYSTATVVNGITNSGVIAGVGKGVNVFGSVVMSGITNSGEITASGTAGIYAGHALISLGITNSGTISAPRAINLNSDSTLTGGFDNSGLLTGIYGLELNGASTLNDGITNSGTISAVRHGISVIYSSTLTGGIANAGTISASGNSGAGIYLYAHSTLSGGITNSGTISTGASANATGILADGSTITDGLTNSGMIAGYKFGVYLQNASTLSGGLTNSGTIFGDSSYGLYLLNSTLTGGVTNSGTIAGGSNIGIVLDHSTLAGGLANSGTISGGWAGLYLNNNSTITDGVTNSGVISGLSSYGIYMRDGSSLSGSLTNSGTIAGGVSGIFLSHATINGGLTNSGTISGGTNAIYVDNTSSLDSLHIAGNDTAKFIGAVIAPNTPATVDSGATYTMDNGQQFTVSGFTNAGTLKIGAGDTGTITGNFTNTGTFSPGIASMSSYGKLNVVGNITLGGTLAANGGVSVSGLNAGTLNGIITYTGARTGSFATVTGANSLFNWTAYNDDANHEVDLVLSAGSGGSGGSAGYRDAAVGAGNTPSIGAGTALDTIAALDPTNPVVLSFLNVPQARISNAISQTLPLLTGGSVRAAEGALSAVNKVIQARIEGNNGLSSGDSFYGDRYFWMKPFGSRADQADRAGNAGYQASVGGLAFGVDGTISDAARVGLSFAYANARINGNSTTAPNSATTDVYVLIGYGSYRLDSGAEMSWQADVGNNNNRGHRDIVFAGTTASSNYSTRTLHGGLGIGKGLPLSADLTFTPSARIDYTNMRDAGYSETGAGALNLNVKARTTEELIFAVDGKLTHKLNENSAVSANLGVGYDAMAKEASVVSSYAGAPGVAFTTTGMAPEAWMLRAGLGYTHVLKDGPEVSARYDAEHRNGFNNQTLSAKLRWAF